MIRGWLQESSIKVPLYFHCYISEGELLGQRRPQDTAGQSLISALIQSTTGDCQGDWGWGHCGREREVRTEEEERTKSVRAEEEEEEEKEEVEEEEEEDEER